MILFSLRVDSFYKVPLNAQLIKWGRIRCVVSYAASVILFSGLLVACGREKEVPAALWIEKHTWSPAREKYYVLTLSTGDLL